MNFIEPFLEMFCICFSNLDVYNNISIPKIHKVGKCRSWNFIILHSLKHKVWRVIKDLLSLARMGAFRGLTVGAWRGEEAGEQSTGKNAPPSPTDCVITNYLTYRRSGSNPGRKFVMPELSENCAYKYLSARQRFLVKIWKEKKNKHIYDKPFLVL